MTGDGDRTKFFPAIERKHGGPISLWIDRLGELGAAKYPEQIAYLREDHGFLVLTVRDTGSGFDPDTLRAAQAAGHHGVDGMQERMARVGGCLPPPAPQAASRCSGFRRTAGHGGNTESLSIA